MRKKRVLNAILGSVKVQSFTNVILRCWMWLSPERKIECEMKHFVLFRLRIHLDLTPQSDDSFILSRTHHFHLIEYNLFISNYPFDVIRVRFYAKMCCARINMSVRICGLNSSPIDNWQLICCKRNKSKISKSSSIHLWIGFTIIYSNLIHLIKQQKDTNSRFNVRTQCIGMYRVYLNFIALNSSKNHQWICDKSRMAKAAMKATISLKLYSVGRRCLWQMCAWNIFVRNCLPEMQIFCL